MLTTTKGELMLPGTLEWWHVVVSLCSGVLALGFTIFGRGFKSWSDRLAELSDRLDRRLTDIEDRMRHHEKGMTELHVSVERRVSWLEAKANGHSRKD
jgi:hypothetical protein